MLICGRPPSTRTPNTAPCCTYSSTPANVRTPDPTIALAIAPICGGIRPLSPENARDVAEKVKDVPCWCFHGDADNAVPVAQSRGMMKALWDAGAHPNYSEYPGVGHNSWDKAYATKELYEWLLMQKLK